MGTHTQEKRVTTDFNQLHFHLESKRELLMEKLKQLETSIHQITGQRERNSFGSEDGDGVADDLELGRYLTWQKRTIDCLSEVEHALGRLEQGTYGLCESCGQQVDPGRLEALPQVSLCLSCKSGESNKRMSVNDVYQTQRKIMVTHDITDPDYQPDSED